ncbi:MAG: chromate transporter [Terrimicrobiaceae bacterium]
MKEDSLTFFHVAVLFASLSLLSIGGGNSVLPEMHRKSVGDYGWLSDRQFADIFAISQAAPGPSVLIVSMIGFEAGNRVGGPFLGILGGLLATLCMIAPAGLLVIFVSAVWAKAKDSPIRHTVESGLAPLTVGLILATSFVMAKASEHDWRGYALTMVCTAIFTFTKANPLAVVAAAGLLGYFHVV